MKLTVDEAGLILKKYVGEQTPIIAFLRLPDMTLKLHGWVDSLTESGLVVRNDTGDIVEIDVRGTLYFEMGDDRDLLEEHAQLKGRYDSCLTLMLPSGAKLSLFEPALSR